MPTRYKCSNCGEEEKNIWVEDINTQLDPEEIYHMKKCKKCGKLSWQIIKSS